jgi:hypothetical protein
MTSRRAEADLSSVVRVLRSYVGLGRGRRYILNETLDASSNVIAAVVPLFERIRLNGHESRSLAELRDTLLPKLLSERSGWRIGRINYE